VSQLLLLDSRAQSPGKATVEEDDATLLIRFFAEVLRSPIENLERFEDNGRVDYILENAINTGVLPPGVELAQAHAILEIYKANMRAVRRYVPRVYPGTVTLFKVPRSFAMPTSDEVARNERDTQVIQDPTMGWGKLASEGVRMVDVPGSHQTMMSKPHVQTIALKINACLDETELMSELGEELAQGNRP
jgi:thioesterase domain-containing protein